MKKGKKIALVALMVVVALAGTIGGVAMAQSGDEETTPATETNRYACLERACEIYQENTGVSIDADELQEALCQAREEQRSEIREQACDRIRQRLIDEGILTEEQLAAWEEWLEARPDEALSEEFQEWLDARPDDLPSRLGLCDNGKRFAFGLGYGIGKRAGGGNGNGNGAE